jgi:hypothetical protein
VRLDAITMIGGRSSSGRRSAQEQRKKMEKLGARRKNEGERIFRPDPLPLYPLSRCLERRHAWCLVFAPPAQSTTSLTRGLGGRQSVSMGQTNW